MKDKVVGIVSKVLEKHLKKLIDKQYPSAKLSKEDREYNSRMNMGSNLMIGILTQDQAKSRRPEVERAIVKFTEAQLIRPEGWAPFNSEAKCLYLLGEYEEASRKNNLAKDHTKAGLGDSPEHIEKEQKRQASFHNLESMINLALGRYDDAIDHCIEGFSLTPNNIHMRLGYVRALCLKDDIDSAMEQLTVMEKMDGFGLWAHDFKSRIEREKEFKSLRKRTAWKAKSIEWEEITKNAMKEYRDAITNEKDKKAKIKKIVGYAAFIALTVGVNIAFGEIFELLGVEELLSGGETTTQSSEPLGTPDQGTMLVDIEPFGDDYEVADLEPFGTDGIELAALDLEPFFAQLASGNLWINDLIIA